MTLQVICKCCGLAPSEVSDVAAAYRAYLTGDSDTPYLAGTRVVTPPESMKKKLKTVPVQGLLAISVSDGQATRNTRKA
jgi:hypothetical protein